MMLSVCMITYNHEKYIAQAIESALMQKTNFDYEIVIGEDCSTDKTRDIVIEYAKKYPEKIKPILNEENLGAIANLVKTLKHCKGKYVALLEGDDYWTDPYKLQKQVDFLETMPDFAICFHRVKIKYEDKPLKERLSNINQKAITTIEDLAHGNYIYTASCVFRNCLSGLPDWFNQCPVGDYPLHLLNAKYGKIKFIDDTMGVYRVHKGGIWSTKNWAYSLEKWVKLLEILRDKFSNDINHIINNTLNFIYFRLARGYCLHNRDWMKTKFYLIKIKNNNPNYFDILIKNINFFKMKLLNRNIDYFYRIKQIKIRKNIIYY